MEILYQIAGWIGTGLIVSAYVLVSTKKVDSQSTIYQLLNLFGAAGVFANVFHQQAWPAAALQVIWGVIASATLLKRRTSH